MNLPDPTDRLAPTSETPQAKPAVMATIQAEKDAMGDEEIDPAYYVPRESGDDN
jgi:hypothetical protein